MSNHNDIRDLCYKPRSLSEIVDEYERLYDESKMKCNKG